MRKTMFFKIITFFKLRVVKTFFRIKMYQLTLRSTYVQFNFFINIIQHKLSISEKKIK